MLKIFLNTLVISSLALSNYCFASIASNNAMYENFDKQIKDVNKHKSKKKNIKKVKKANKNSKKFKNLKSKTVETKDIQAVIQPEYTPIPHISLTNEPQITQPTQLENSPITTPAIQPPADEAKPIEVMHPAEPIPIYVPQTIEMKKEVTPLEPQKIQAQDLTSAKDQIIPTHQSGIKETKKAAPTVNNIETSKLPNVVSEPAVADKKETVKPEATTSAAHKSEAITTPAASKPSTIKKETLSSAVSKKSKTPLPSSITLNFKGASFELSKEQQEQLKPLILDGKSRLKIVGFASNNGEEHNSAARRISLQRVISVRKHLINNNYNSSLIAVQAMGTDNLKNSERVEIYVERD
ncbi:OmpA family protein [Rickettsiales endosymbiont of Stachyamoeba lipophora]|uniref:OmpA family protein n=1 Tax=Rickettsiales endosymbiont of Stachyamoeba lipophora TaxID=2486578 RepID=UPI000F648C5F|nr:OmpA family protein [Rickettsiales endosymbiont of Stachyamoeba lipophora]AZL15591.1 hypothetical protein EF513_03375 [Rickettsiales endosymbiont of Stachyamoeba lipophora]